MMMMIMMMMMMMVCFPIPSDGEADSSDKEGDQATATSESRDESGIDDQESEDVDEHTLLDEAYDSLKDAFTVNDADGSLVGGDQTPAQLEKLPRRWPLARIMISLKEFIARLVRLMAG